MLLILTCHTRSGSRPSHNVLPSRTQHGLQASNHFDDSIYKSTSPSIQSKTPKYATATMTPPSCEQKPQMTSLRGGQPDKPRFRPGTSSFPLRSARVASRRQSVAERATDSQAGFLRHSGALTERIDRNSSFQIIQRSSDAMSCNEVFPQSARDLNSRLLHHIPCIQPRSTGKEGFCHHLSQRNQFRLFSLKTTNEQDSSQANKEGKTTAVPSICSPFVIKFSMPDSRSAWLPILAPSSLLQNSISRM